MLVNYITVIFKDKDRKPVMGFYKDFDFREGFLRIDALNEKQVIYINLEEVLTFILTYKEKQ